MSDNKAAKPRNINLDILRVILCAAVLFYHLGLLKGGYLAVCSFFALSGYLSCRSMLGRDAKGILRHYPARLLRLYLPLAAVVFITLLVVTRLPEIVWLSMKPESTSVLLGYNNFWQIEANLDYFARHTESPFMHFWYIAILLQFELVFPLIFGILRFVEKKISRGLAGFLIVAAAAAATGLFLYMALSGKYSAMEVYYSTQSRVFSLLWGVAACWVSRGREGKCEEKTARGSTAARLLFIAASAAMTVMFFTVDAADSAYAAAMVASTVLACGAIAAGLAAPLAPKKTAGRAAGKLLSGAAGLSYEIYLVQYPLIFLYQYLFYGRYSPAGRALLITAACVLISIPLHFCFNWKGGRTRVPKLRALAALLLAAVCFLGASDYVDARDHREELAQLEAQLEASEEEMLERQAAYAAARAARAAEEESSREKMLSDLAAGREGLADVAANLDITAIGDSVMLGAVKNLSDRFPNCYCDAAKSRTAWVVCGIIEDLKSKNMLGDIVILHFGTNGDAPERIKDDIMASCGDRRVYWVGVTNDRSVHVNDKLKAFVEKYDNASYIDWPAYSSGHGEYFGTDGIHLTNEGREAYTQMIYDVLYGELLERYEAEAAEIIKAHDDSVVPEETMAFYGDELLAAVYDELYVSYPEAFYAADAVSSFESLVESIKKSGTDGVLPRRMIFVLGRDTKLGADQYKELLSLCEGSGVTIMTTGDTADLLALKSSADFELVDLGSELDSDPAYLAADRKHLSDEGRRAAAALIKGAL